MYLGFLLILIGWVAHLANGFAALLSPLFVPYMTYYQIRPEERILGELFGTDLQVFTASVRR
jgi:protein-S-isoprenylcysteine O-methyltransferase Ste14